MLVVRMRRCGSVCGNAARGYLHAGIQISNQGLDLFVTESQVRHAYLLILLEQLDRRCITFSEDFFRLTNKA